MAADGEAVTITAEPVVRPLSAATLFGQLPEEEKLYLHHLARYAYVTLVTANALTSQQTELPGQGPESYLSKCPRNLF